MEKGMKDIPELSISCNKNITCTTILELKVGSRCKSCLQTSYFFNEQANLKRYNFRIKSRMCERSVKTGDLVNSRQYR